nr:hypothetical protein [Brevundimonas diminuta]
MHLRPVEWLTGLGAFTIGALLPPGVFAGEAGRLLTTFLGLVAASILPTISLIVGGMVVGSRSVQHLGDLGSELGRTVDALFGIFGLIALTVIVLMALAIQTPFGDYIPPVLASAPSRIGQGFVAFLGMLIVSRSGAIPGAISKSLSLRTTIAVDEARKRTVEQADVAKVKTRSGFVTKEGFGRTTRLHDPESVETAADHEERGKNG